MSFLSSLFGFGGSQPRTQQVIQSSKLPEEIAPFAKDVLEDAQKLYEAEMEKGYKPYLDPTIAPLTLEQEQAMAGISGLVGTGTGLQEEALGLFRKGDERFTDLTPEQMETYMSPYQRAVTDIEKREAQKVFESQVMPQFEKQAVSMGGMSGMGSRAGVQAAQLGQAQMQQMGDIESRGLQSSYQDARNLFQQQQAAQRATGQDIGKLAPAMFAQGLGEYGALQTVGEQKQAMGQEALDEAYFRYLEEQAYPQEKLAGYSGFVYGNPLMQQRVTTKTSPAMMGPSKGQQLMGLGLGAAKLYGMGGGGTQGGFTWGGLAQGLAGKTGGGIASLPVVNRLTGGGYLDEGEATNLLALSEEASLPTAPSPTPTPTSASGSGLTDPGIRNILASLSTARGGDTFKKEKELVGKPRFGFGAAMRAAMRPSDIPGREKGLLQAGVEAMGAGIEEYEVGKQKRDEALIKIRQRETDAEMKYKTELAKQRIKNLGSKYSPTMYKSLSESAAALSGYGVRFVDGELKSTGKQQLTTDILEDFQEIVADLERRTAYWIQRGITSEIEAVARAKADYEEDHRAGKSPSGDNLEQGMAGRQGDLNAEGLGGGAKKIEGIRRFGTR